MQELTPFLSAGIMMNIVAYFSDKYRQRGAGIIFQACLCIIGLPIMGFAHAPGVRYFGVFLATAGCNGNVPLVLTYQANNIRGQWVSQYIPIRTIHSVGEGKLLTLITETCVRLRHHRRRRRNRWYHRVYCIQDKGRAVLPSWSIRYHRRELPNCAYCGPAQCQVCERQQEGRERRDQVGGC